MRWTFALARRLADDERVLFESIAGVKAWPTKLSVPPNAAPVIRSMLQGRSIAFSLGLPERDAALPKNAKIALAHLRPWVPEFLTPYQKEGLQFALDAPGGSAMLKWATGSGKTLAAIVWALSSHARVVVVTKAAVRPQWRGEVERFTDIRPTILEGETPTPLSVNDHFVIISYEILPAWIGALEAWARGNQLRPSVVFDESHKVQSHKRWEATVAKEDEAAAPSAEELVVREPTATDLAALSSIARSNTKVTFSLRENIAAAAMRLSASCSRRLATTATPMKDRVRNLWAQLDLIHPYQWGNYWTWARRYCAAYERNFGGMDDSGSSNLDELKTRLAVVAHSVSKTEANRFLPPLRRIVTYVPIKDQVASGMVAEVRAAARHGTAALREALLMEAAARKRKRLVEKVDMNVEGGLKTVVFTGRRKDCDKLLEAFRDRYTSVITPVLVVGGHGGHSPTERDHARVAFMESKGPAVLVGTTDAWGEGLNLQDTDHALIALLPVTPGAVIQAEGRFHRLGMTRNVLVEYLVAEGTYDERISTILLAKLPALEKVIGQDEISGFGRELSGADDPDLMSNLAAKIIGGTRKRTEEEAAP